MPDKYERQQPVYPQLTQAQWAFLSTLTDQRCANLIETADFVSDLPEQTRDFLSKAKPTTLEWLQDLREEEVVGLKAYLRLRSSTSYVAWAIGGIIGGIVAVITFWNAISPFFRAPK